MDSFDVTSEGPENFADATYDPDLEARLYAEIYYSNDTYAEDCQAANQEIPKTAYVVQNATSSLSVETSVSSNIDADPGVINEDCRTSETNFFHDTSFGSCRTSSVPQVHGGTNDGVKRFGAPGLNNHTTGYGDYRYARRVFPKRCRLLAQENLWSRKEDTRKLTPLVCEATVPATNLETDKTYEYSTKEHAPIAETRDASIDDTAWNEQNESIACNDDRPPDEPCLSKEKRSKAKKKNKHLFPTRAFCGTAKLRRRHNAVTRARESGETSKYRVISKKTKLNMKEANLESVGISSDSDDSILEVPVPPKAEPVVIQLVDSDEECPTAKALRKEKASNLAERDDELSSGGTSHSDGTDAESTEDEPSAAEADNGTIVYNGSDLILNCTNQQPGPSSNREKTGTVHRTGASGYMYSDDSMTESEANNWSNIAAGDTSTARSHETSSADKSMDQSFGLLWDQLSLDHSAGLYPSKDSTDQSMNAPAEVDTSLIDCGEEQTERTKRKRPKNLNARSPDDSNVSEIPEKRSKGNTSEPCTNKSLIEYFFTPMSKELQAFYNNPCSNENMDVYDIQRRMPRHPRYWTILDADLRPSPKRRGKVCPYCKNNAHFGRRCPEKSLQPICFMCGLRGHAGIRCPQTMCLTCGHEYTSFRQTCCRCFKLTCSMCNGMGHTRENCPDLWRRYHDTTTESQPTPKDLSNTMKSSQNLSCCNCAKRGHDATMCKQLRWSQHFPTPMYVTSYTDGPIYPALRQERIEERNSGDHVEVVQIADDDTDRGVDSPNSVFQPHVIFQSSRRNDFQTPDDHSLSIRLDRAKSIHLNGLLSGNLKPSFLYKLKNFFIFTVRIVRKADDLVVLDICSKHDDTVSGIEKLVMQWLSRSDEDKSRLRYDFRYINNKKTKAKLRRNLEDAKNTTEPMILIERIAYYEKILSKARAKLDRSVSVKNVPVSKTSELQKRAKISMRHIINRQNKLTLSLYSRAWMDDNGRVFRSFCDLANRLINSSSQEMSIRDYTDLLYLNNELFTFNKNDATMKAIEKVKLCSLSSAAGIPPLLQLPGTSLTSSTTTNPPVEEIDSRDVQSPISNVTGNGGGDPDNQLPSCENHSEGISKPAPPKPVTAVVVNGLTEDNQPMSNSFDTTEHCSANITSTDILPDKLELQNSSGTLLLNYYRKIEPTPDKTSRGRKSVCLLADLPKKKRKLYRRSAREAIGLANTSNLPWLRTLAQRLSFKMNDASVQTSDVQALQEAIANTLNARKAKAKRFARPRTILPRKARTQLGTIINSSEFVTNAH